MSPARVKLARCLRHEVCYRSIVNCQQQDTHKNTDNDVSRLRKVKVKIVGDVIVFPLTILLIIILYLQYDLSELLQNKKNLFS